ncbi:MAG: MFS transporter [Ignavibacteriaceae bacterium]|nr:MFS transporter [Ignavibacteriaceae bacterium]
MSVREIYNSKPDPSPVLRWSVLVLISLAMFGNYYVYDSIAPVADLLVSQLKFSDSDIGLLQGIYSIPNIIMVLIGGIIIDRIGTRPSIFLFSVLCFIGSIVTVATEPLKFYGDFVGGIFGINSELAVMSTGRLIFGLGAESLIVAVTTALGKWFKGKELSFAFGINLTIARLGSFAADNSPTWASSYFTAWDLPLLIAIVMASLSVLTSIAYWVLDKYAKSNYNLKPESKQDEIKLSEIFSFNKSYWYIVLLCVTFYSAIFPFRTFAIKFFQDFHGYEREWAGALNSTLIFASMVLTPLFGLLSDFIGKRSFLMMLGSILLIPVYLMLVYTPIPPVIPMVMMGISFSLIPAIMWPSVALIVPEDKLGTAYGVMTLIQNIGLAGFNLLIGWANDYSGGSATNPQGYALGMWIFSSLGFLGFIFAYLLRRSEKSSTGMGLEKSMKQRKAESENAAEN